MSVWLRARVRAAGCMGGWTRAGTGRVRLWARALVAAAIIAASRGLTTALVASALIATSTIAGITFRLLRAITAAALTTPTHNRFSFNIRVRFETGDHYFGNFAFEHALDVAQVIAFVHAH